MPNLTFNRRLLLAAIAAATSPAPTRSDSMLPPRAVGVIATGFTISPDQYSFYASLLEDLAIPTIVFNDQSTMRNAVSLSEGVTKLLDEAEAVACGLEGRHKLPLFLVGHSRGAKLAALAAIRSTRPVSGLVLLDPVDATPFDKETVLPMLSTLSPPTAVIGAAVGRGDCAPRGSNYAAFFDALAPETPKLLLVMGHAGHLQFLAHRADILDICASGRDKDDDVHGVVAEVISAWTAAFVPECASESKVIPGCRAHQESLHKLLQPGRWRVQVEIVTKSLDSSPLMSM